MFGVKKSHIVILILGIIAFTLLFFFSRGESKKFAKLNTEGITDTAVIVREFIGAKNRLYFEYIFYAGKVKYNGFLCYSSGNGVVTIGDSVLIKYLPDEPENISKVIENEDFSIKKIH
jgi:hypothetical protein